jgi:hypothetical protein
LLRWSGSSGGTSSPSAARRHTGTGLQSEAVTEMHSGSGVRAESTNISLSLLRLLCTGCKNWGNVSGCQHIRKSIYKNTKWIFTRYVISGEPKTKIFGINLILVQFSA